MLASHVKQCVSMSGEAEAFLRFQAGSISEPHDCRAELSRAALRSSLHIPHAARISETDKILSLGVIKRKNNDITFLSKEQACG